MRELFVKLEVELTRILSLFMFGLLAVAIVHETPFNWGRTPINTWNIVKYLFMSYIHTVNIKITTSLHGSYWITLVPWFCWRKNRQVACQLLGCEDKASSWGSFIQIQNIYAYLCIYLSRFHFFVWFLTAISSSICSISVLGWYSVFPLSGENCVLCDVCSILFLREVFGKSTVCFEGWFFARLSPQKSTLSNRTDASHMNMFQWKHE